jgi:4-amino-4-deoxy-L-arabinose transferase-like glycosyltransferase
MSTTTLRRLPRAQSPHPQPVARMHPHESTWARAALVLLLVATGAAYIWNLSASGEANSFYAAAVQAGTKSWKAFFFGSLDVSNFITVDKPPASLWVMALSGRIFGFSTLSMLVPQVLEGVAAVALLYAAVKRWFGPGAGLLAGAALATTPVAALMFRFNNPDALLVLLLVAAAYCLVRALEKASTRWMLAVGTMIGLAFLAKMMQAFLVVPGFALVYLVAAPTGLRRRLLQLGAGAMAIVLSAGWWVAAVALWPVGSRPMIDGSPDNNIFNLILGYNGLGRIFRASGGGGAGGAGGASFSGSPGLLRMFNDLMGGQAAWLLPAALLALALGLWTQRRAPRTDRTRAAVLLWGGWLVVTALVFSLSSGIIHTYYTVALAPAIAALVAIGGVSLWRRRETRSARAWLAAATLGTTAWAWVLLDRTPAWESWLRVLIVVCGLLAAGALLAPPRSGTLGRRMAGLTAVVALSAAFAGPVAYAAQTIGTAHTGSIPSAGPSSSGGFGGGAPRGAGGTQSTSTALVTALETGHYRWAAAVAGSKTAASLELATDGTPVMAIGGFNNQGGNISLTQFKADVAKGEIHYYIAGGAGGGPGGAAAGGPGGAGAGGPGGSRPSEAFTPGGGGPPPSGARPTGAPRGGFGGFGGGQGGPGQGGSTSAITTWVKAHFKSVTIGGQTVYDLTQPLS